MFPIDPFEFTAVAIEFIGALFIIAYIILAIITLFRTRSIVQARLIVADGAILGLNFKLAGSLLKTIELHTWTQILIFVSIFALRFVLKRIFSWEQAQLQRRILEPE